MSGIRRGARRDNIAEEEENDDGGGGADGLESDLGHGRLGGSGPTRWTVFVAFGFTYIASKVSEIRYSPSNCFYSKLYCIYTLQVEEDEDKTR